MAIMSLEDVIASLMADEEKLMIYISYAFLIWGGLNLVSLYLITAPYGRYSRKGWGFFVPTKLAWLIQELPSFCIPLLMAFYADYPRTNNHFSRYFVLGLFILHYVHRTFIYPLLIRGGKPTPLIPFLMAIFFCCVNGYLQAGYILKFSSLEWTLQTYLRMVAGTVLFFAGMIINIHSDSILRSLRKLGETDYKIPYGGMFTYVSGANFFGEILEWLGFAMVNWTLPALSFAVFTVCNIGPRALQHHRWYQRKFDDYPKDRKAIIPFVL